MSIVFAAMANCEPTVLEMLRAAMARAAQADTISKHHHTPILMPIRLRTVVSTCENQLAMDFMGSRACKPRPPWRSGLRSFVRVCGVDSLASLVSLQVKDVEAEASGL